MKHFSTLAQALALILSVSACGVRVVPQATPTIDLVQLQVTAVAAAYTAVAKTQAAIATPTSPLPTIAPTDTAVPAVTLQSLPTFEEVLTVTPGGSPVPVDTPVVVDPCVNTVLPNMLTGKTIQMRIKNPTDAAVNVTVYLQRDKPEDVCGYRSYSIAAQGTVTISDLVEGCYSLWAWNPDPKNYFMVTNGTSCLNSSQSWAFDIVPNSGIQLRQ